MLLPARLYNLEMANPTHLSSTDHRSHVSKRENNPCLLRSEIANVRIMTLPLSLNLQTPDHEELWVLGDGVWMTISSDRRLHQLVTEVAKMAEMAKVWYVCWVNSLRRSHWPIACKKEKK